MPSTSPVLQFLQLEFVGCPKQLNDQSLVRESQHRIGVYPLDQCTGSSGGEITDVDLASLEEGGIRGVPRLASRYEDNLVGRDGAVGHLDSDVAARTCAQQEGRSDCGSCSTHTRTHNTTNL